MSSPSTPKAPAFHPASFVSLDPNSLQYTGTDQANQLATQYDRQAYAASDADFAARHPELAQANKINEDNIASQAEGNVPAGLQGQLTNAGLADASAAFGNNIAPGSTGQFGVARNLGIGLGDYQGIVQNELAQANAQSPHRTFGLGGQGALQIQLANQATRNSVVEGNFQGDNQVRISNATGQNSATQGGFAGALQAQALANANRTAQINGGIALANTAVSAYGQSGGFSGGGGGVNSNTTVQPGQSINWSSMSGG